MEKNRFCQSIQPSLCTEFIFRCSESNGTRFFVRSRDTTILLNDSITSHMDPISLKRALTVHSSSDAIYQSLSDAQKFDAIKPRSIQQPADLELYNDILTSHAEQIKETAKDSIERAQLLRELSQKASSDSSQSNSEEISNDN